MIRSERFKDAAGTTALIGIGSYMGAISWRKWADPLIDYGIQLYQPWQINQGKVLVLDLESHYGPFSQYWDAFLFRIFGTHLLTLALFNHLLIALLTWILFRIFRKTAGRTAAYFCCAVFLSVFAFPQYTVSGNYNYVCPYVTEIVHAAFFAWATIAAFGAYLRRRSASWLWVIGLCYGIALMTKVEVLAALTATLLAGFGTLWIAERPAPRDIFRHGLMLTGSALLPAAAFFLYFCTKTDPAQAAAVLLHPFTLILNPAVFVFPMYRGLSGMSDPASSFNVIFAAARWHAVLLGGVILSCALIRRAPNDAARKQAILGFWIASAAVLAFLYHRLYWVHFFRPLPFYMAALSIWALTRGLSRATPPAEKTKWILEGTLSVFALFMLWKIILKSHVLHYGFVLALPGVLVLTAFLLKTLPELLGKNFGDCGYLRPVLAGFLCIFMLWHVNRCREVYALKTFPLGKGADLLYEVTPRRDWMEKILGQAIEKIETTLQPGQTLAVFPTGQILNYWTRRASSVGFQAYRAFDLVVSGGEEAMVQALRATPPDFVALIDMNASSGHGDPSTLGKDYGLQFFQWIQSDYAPIYQVAPPDRSSYGLILLRRKEGLR